MKKIRRPFAALLDRRYFPALLIVLALAVGMLLPQAVLAMQGVHLEKTDTLLPTGISVGRQSSETAKLDILTRFYNAMENGSGDEIELSRGRYMTAEQVLERVTELKTIADAAGLPFEMPPDNIQSTSGLQSEIQPDDVQRIAIPVLVVFNDESSMTSSIVWVAQLYWEKNELNFVVDDETGMILSAYFYLYNNDAKANGRDDRTRRLPPTQMRRRGASERRSAEATASRMSPSRLRLAASETKPDCSLPRPITTRNILPSAIYALHSTAKQNAE